MNNLPPFDPSLWDPRSFMQTMATPPPVADSFTSGPGLGDKSKGDPNHIFGTSTAPAANKKRSSLKDEEEAEEEGEDMPADELRQKQTRLLKNRQAAQQFRKRQKSHIVNLESQVDSLSAENAVLASRVDMLVMENKLIRDQLDYMRNFVMNCLQLTFRPNTTLQDLQRFGQITSHPAFKPPQGGAPGEGTTAAAAAAGAGPAGGMPQIPGMPTLPGGPATSPSSNSPAGPGSNPFSMMPPSIQQHFAQQQQPPAI